MHKSCWKRWTLQAGTTCVICRVSPETQPQVIYYENDFPHIEPPVIRIEYSAIRNTLYLFQALMLTVLFLAMNHTQMTMPVHDEL